MGRGGTCEVENVHWSVQKTMQIELKFCEMKGCCFSELIAICMCFMVLKILGSQTCPGMLYLSLVQKVFAYQPK